MQSLYEDMIEYLTLKGFSRQEAIDHLAGKYPEEQPQSLYEDLIEGLMLDGFTRQEAINQLAGLYPDGRYPSPPEKSPSESTADRPPEPQKPE